MSGDTLMAGSIAATTSTSGLSSELTAVRALTWAALVVAIAALAGSLFLSMGMGLRACPLCFYQRTFVMSLVAVLGMGLATRTAPSTLALLSLPLAVAGLGVALFHVSLEVTDKLECPAGVLGLGTAPQQSLSVYIVLCVLLTLAVPRTNRWSAGAAAVLGILLAAASCTSNPPMPAAPTAPYKSPPEICRPPFHAR
jgi:disulfide bond formation protein DsbB